MDAWTVARVQQLSPDAASLKAGQGLAATRHWVSLGSDGDAIWGECQGSGSKPYQVRMDLAESASKCSCPSRKFPCKHALGLMLLFVSGATAPAQRPAWVEEWFAERNARAEKKREKAEAPPKPVDGQAQLKRKENRIERIGEGLAALKLWLTDLVRDGLAAVPSKGYAFFDEQARRLIDAQAPGVARRVQALAGVASTGAGWHDAFLQELASLYLLIRGFERLAAFPVDIRELLLNAVGVPRPQEEVLATPAVADRWQIISQQFTVEDKLRVQQTWLLGEQTARPAYILAFAHGAQPLDSTLVSGTAFVGEVCFYPGDRLRAVVKSKQPAEPIHSIVHAVDIETLRDRYATQRAANPWIERFVGALADVTPSWQGDTCVLIDSAKRELSLTVDSNTAWALLAISGGHPINIVIEFDGKRARPLAAFLDGRFIRFRLDHQAEAA